MLGRMLVVVLSLVTPSVVTGYDERYVEHRASLGEWEGGWVARHLVLVEYCGVHTAAAGLLEGPAYITRAVHRARKRSLDKLFVVGSPPSRQGGVLDDPARYGSVPRNSLSVGVGMLISLMCRFLLMCVFPCTWYCCKL